MKNEELIYLTKFRNEISSKILNGKMGENVSEFSFWRNPFGKMVDRT